MFSKIANFGGGFHFGRSERKPKTYREAAQARGIVQLVTLACETGGRWSPTCVEFVRSLAKQKAKEAPPVMRRSAELGWTSRWWSLLSCAAQRSFIASITDVDTHFFTEVARASAVPRKGLRRSAARSVAGCLAFAVARVSPRVTVFCATTRAHSRVMDHGSIKESTGKKRR